MAHSAPVSSAMENNSALLSIAVNLLLWVCETWALLSEDCNQLNVCFNKWVRAMTGTKWSEIREKCLTNKQLCERLDNIESFDEIYNHRCLNWFIKLAVMPATESENRLPRKLLGAWCPTGNHLPGRPLKNTRHSHLDLLNNLQFDESDPMLRNRLLQGGAMTRMCVLYCLNN